MVFQREVFVNSDNQCPPLPWTLNTHLGKYTPRYLHKVCHAFSIFLSFSDFSGGEVTTFFRFFTVLIM